MEIEYSGKNLTVRDSLKSKVDKKVEKLQRFTGPILSAHASFELERHAFKVKLLVHCPRERIYKATGQAEDILAAAGAAVDAIEQQAKKEKTKRLSGRSKVAAAKKNVKEEKENAEPLDAPLPKSNRISRRDDLFNPKPLNLSDAIILLEESDDPVLVYEDHETSKVSVLFKEGEKRYSLVTPPGRS